MKVVEPEGDVNPNGNWFSLNDPQWIAEGTGGVGNRRTSQDHQNLVIFLVGYNNVKSKKLEVTYFYSDCCERPLVNTSFENLQGVK